MGLQAQLQVRQDLVEAAPGLNLLGQLLAVAWPGVLRKQHAAFLKGLAQGGHKQAACPCRLQLRFGQGRVQGAAGLVQVRGFGQLHVAVVELAARKHIGPAQHVGEAMAFHQKHLQPLDAIPENDDRGGIPRRGVDDGRSDFH